MLTLFKFELIKNTLNIQKLEKSVSLPFHLIHVIHINCKLCFVYRNLNEIITVHLYI